MLNQVLQRLSKSRRSRRQKNRAQRSRFLRSFEALEDRRLLTVVVVTDALEYVPEQPISIVASGFTPGETVEFQVRRIDEALTGSVPAYEPWQIVDGSQFDSDGTGDADEGGNYDQDGMVDGGIQTTWAIGENENPGRWFEVTTTGLTSGEIATWQFTAREAEPFVPSPVSVSVDKEDYQPSETAVVSATGFTPGETVEFLVLHADETPNTGEGHSAWQVTDGSVEDLDGVIDGNIQTTWLVAEDDSLNSIFELTATGLTSEQQAETHFSDALDRLFYENFNSGSFIKSNWSKIDARIDFDHDNHNKGPHGSSKDGLVELDGDDQELRSKTINLSNYVSGTLSYQVQNQGHENVPESVDHLHVQYKKSDGSWADLRTETISNTTNHTQTDRTVSLPSAAFHSGFQFRFNAYDSDVTKAGVARDDWFVDVVQLHAQPNRKPSISISGGGEGLDNASHTLSWTASDVDGNLSTVRGELQSRPLEGGVWAGVGNPSFATNGSLVQYPSHGPADYRLKVQATDVKGANVTKYSSILNVRDDDTTKPTISVTDALGVEIPENSGTTQFAGDDQQFLWSVNDASGSTSTVTITKNGQVISSRTYDENIAADSFDFNNDGVGQFQIMINAIDQDKDRPNDQETQSVTRIVNVLNSPPT
ncbi:MAG: hypothetical protein ACI9HK_005075, partial [Pirellulaceae bacterium]